MFYKSILFSLHLALLSICTSAEQCRCENGFCKRNDKGQFVCSCPPEWGLYSSTKCEKCNCGNNSNCTFDVGWFSKQKTCICKVGYGDKKGFCTGTCDDDSDCRNDAKCERSGMSKFCKCLNGTEGDYCEEITECKHLNCEPDAQCTYDVPLQRAMCLSSDVVVFIGNSSNEKKLSNNYNYRKTCVNDDSCKNGGKCNRATTGTGSFCNCLRRVGGDFCEDVTECNDLKCGPDAPCTYIVHMEAAICLCTNELLHFDHLQGKCIRSCNDDTHCMNGGECKRSGNANFCRCQKGTKGEYCEEVSECKGLNCGPGRRCTYDVHTQTAKCLCTNEDHHFNQEQGKCIRKCSDDTDCKNGAECKRSGSAYFCRCLRGTEGDYCEEVKECKDLNCGSDARCTYDVRMQAAMCLCRSEDLHFDHKQRKCIRKCNDDTDCRNGGECKRGGTANFCRCLVGTEGDYCEEVKECKDLNCGTDARCAYDVRMQAAKCLCRSEDLHFDYRQRKCIRTCDDDKDCRNGGECKRGGTANFCRCLKGTEGDLCEEVKECKDLNCGPDARCTYDVRMQRAKCLCRSADLHFDDKQRKCISY